MSVQRFFLIVIALFSLAATGAYFAFGRDNTGFVLCWIDGFALLGAVLPSDWCW